MLPPQIKTELLYFSSIVFTFVIFSPPTEETLTFKPPPPVSLLSNFRISFTLKSVPPLIIDILSTLPVVIASTSIF